MLTVINSIFLCALFFLLHILKRNNQSLSFRILVSLALGILFGVCLKWMSCYSDLQFINQSLNLIGHAYLAFLKMLVIPLILSSIIYTILNLGTNTIAEIKKISIYTCAMLLSLTAIASLIGIYVGKLFQVGMNLNLPELIETPKHTYTGITNTLLGMLPANPIASMAQENTIAIVLFAVLIGVSARLLQAKEPEKIDVFKKLIDSLFAIIKKLTSLILELTPYGIFALISLLLFEQGSTLLLAMLNYIAAMYTAMFLMFCLHCIILSFSGYKPWQYLKKAYAPLLVAFTTRSSFGTLPVTEETLNTKFNAKQVVSTFVPSIGATIGMNACAGIFPAMLVVMTLTILNQTITWDLILMVMFINAIASLGISGIPGTAYIAATITLTSLNLPYAIVGLVQGIDPIIDMGRTAINVNGVMTTALTVNHWILGQVEGEEQSLENEIERA